MAVSRIEPGGGRMNQPLRAEVEEAFAAVLELSEAEQQKFLAREYSHNPELRAQVETLIRAYRAAGNFLEPAGSQPALPATIGRYQILRLLGEGGMGVVYEAEQDQPRRTVALKVIKPGLAGTELLRRFERESQALGRLQHPGIAQVYEAGAADSGMGPQPYFAMELIRGAPLLEYADAHQLKTPDRLALMRKVCEAVQHAHQRGIIHSDLKPANILVDETGQPKILDFGIARTTDQDVQAPGQTDLGQIVGTLAYMSPEQVLGNPLEVDTRSDVYALGVILFEVLAGRLPYKISGQLHEAVQMIREEDPPPLGSISRTYRGDVEAIVAKALAKDKALRYSSAAELAADVRRYLRDEPIVARGAGFTYQLQKFVRRNKTLVAGVAAVFTVLITGIIASNWEAARARRAEQTAEAISAFLQNDLLDQASAMGQARPNTKPDPDLKVRTALDRAAARIPGKFDKQPLVEASIRQAIGETYNHLGLYPEAQRQTEQALQIRRRILGEQHGDTLVTMNSLAELNRLQGKYAQAEQLYVRVLEDRHHLLGEVNAATLSTMHGLALVYYGQGKYAQAEQLYPKLIALKRRVLGDEHPDTLVALNNLAGLYLAEGKYAKAEPLYTGVLQVDRKVLGDEHPDTLSTMNNLAVLYKRQGRYGQAEPLYSTVLQIKLRVLGEDHPETLISINNLAILYQAKGDFARAEPLLRKVLNVRRRLLGPEHPSTLRSMNALAATWLNQGRYRESEPLLASAIEVRRRILGGEHPDTLDSFYTLARLYLGRSEYSRAEATFDTVLDVQRRALGPEHPDTLETMGGLALLRIKQGKPSEAGALYARIVDVRHRVLGAGHPDTLEALALLGEVRLAQRRYAEAELLLREALVGEEKSNLDRWQRYKAESMLGASLMALERFGEAESLLMNGYRGLFDRKDAIPWDSRPALGQAGVRIIELYRNWGKAEKVADWRQRLQAATPTDHVQ
jgi:tetratricopeptide (TPR) repeat protein